jgi:hypothetical protein
MPIYHGHQWAVPSVAFLREQMRRVFEDHGEAARRGAQARADVLARYDVPVVARCVNARFHQLVQHHG